jgi:hypothetical protein
VTLPGSFLRWLFFAQVAGAATELRGLADLDVLRGLLLLEAGQDREAEAAFRRALAVWKGPRAVRAGAGLDFTGRPVAQQCLRWLTGGGGHGKEG